jgi:Holliday junction DNA helicase RuvB
MGMEVLDACSQEQKPIATPVTELAPNKQYTFMPRTLEEFIGQDRAKDRIRINVQKILTIKPTHFLFSGAPGHGKTTLGYVICNTLKAIPFYTLGVSTDRNVICNFLEFSQVKKGLCVLFIDEIHSMSTDTAEVLYPLVEYFKYGEDHIKPFILLGATTEKAQVHKKFQPLLDRCGCAIELDFYTEGDIEKIIMQYSNQLYPEVPLPIEVCKVIANNSKAIPRISLSLLDDYVTCGDINRVLRANNIIKDGLRPVDVSLLSYLKDAGRPVGQEALSAYAGVALNDYKVIYEPYLVRKDYILRTSAGRVITKKGLSFLSSLRH